MKEIKREKQATAAHCVVIFIHSNDSFDPFVDQSLLLLYMDVAEAYVLQRYEMFNAFSRTTLLRIKFAKCEREKKNLSLQFVKYVERMITTKMKKKLFSLEKNVPPHTFSGYEAILFPAPRLCTSKYWIIFVFIKNHEQKTKTLWLFHRVHGLVD